MRSEIVDLINKAINEENEEKLDLIYTTLKRKTGYPKPFDLIFWPEKDYSIEEMAEIMVSYRGDK